MIFKRKVTVTVVSLAMLSTFSSAFLPTTMSKKAISSQLFLGIFGKRRRGTISTRSMSVDNGVHLEKDNTPEKKLSFLERSASYKELIGKLQTITQLRQASAVLDYDRMVLMPSSDGAAASRAGQQSALASVIHEKSTDPSIGELVKAAELDLEDSDKEEKKVLDLTRKAFEKNEVISPELEGKRAALSSSAYAAWAKARSADDYSMFEPILGDCFKTMKQFAEAYRSTDAKYESEPLYSIMLDEFEMGMKASRIDDIFGEIEDALVPLIRKVLGPSATPPRDDALNGKFDIASQKKVNEEIVTALGYNIEGGRIDESLHPFSISFSPSDVRITSRYSTNEWYQGLAATMHEGGHAMYEQNLGDSGLEIDSFLSMGTHESQSLFWERHVGMSKEFCEWCTPKLRDAYGKELDCTAEELYGAVNKVSPGFIRVEADELTYPLHVILRYNIERDVIGGNLAVNDIPTRWNESMQSMLSVTVTKDSLGCLQDMHWSGLAIGYFPTYLIGSATAAQLAYYCEKDIPDMYERISRGEFSDIKAWLTEKVHRHGRRYDSLDALLKDQVGEELNPKYFINYLTEKYTELYKC
jgi:carboxypeptidase Taq